MNNIQKDILTVKTGIICHQVNCQGVMGAGLALKIAKKWPVVKADYIRHASGWKQENGDDSTVHLLGNTLHSWVAPDLCVCSIFGQDEYGRDKTHTRYLALAFGLSRVRTFSVGKNLAVYIPHGIGCGLAGGDWSVVSALIEQELPDAYICHL